MTTRRRPRRSDPRESYLGVLDAQRSVYAAEDQLAQSDRNASVTLIAIDKALRGGWET